MAISDELADLPQRERERRKVGHFASHILTSPRSFQRNNIRWTIHDFGRVDRDDVPMLRLVVSARPAPNGQWLFQEKELFFVNPPILVPDGEDGAGKPRFREDLKEALRTMLDALL